MKNIVTVTRYWHNPQIKTEVSIDKIQLGIDLDDFVVVLANEFKNITMTFTKNQFLEKLNQAKNKVIQKIKEESIKAI